MEDFEIIEHLILPDNSDVCNFVIHSFTTNRNCKKYILDEVATLIDTDNFEIRYPRGQEFKIELYDEVTTGNILTIGTWSTGGVPAISGFYVDNLSSNSNVTVEWTFVALTGDASGVVVKLNNSIIMNVSDTQQETLSMTLDAGAVYDYEDFPFWVTASSFGSSGASVEIKMRIVSSDTDTNPNPDYVNLTRVFTS